MTVVKKGSVSIIKLGNGRFLPIKTEVYPVKLNKENSKKVDEIIKCYQDVDNKLSEHDEEMGR